MTWRKVILTYGVLTRTVQYLFSRLCLPKCLYFFDVSDPLLRVKGLLQDLMHASPLKLVCSSVCQTVSARKWYFFLGKELQCRIFYFTISSTFAISVLTFGGACWTRWKIRDYISLHPDVCKSRS